MAYTMKSSKAAIAVYRVRGRIASIFGYTFGGAGLIALPQFLFGFDGTEPDAGMAAFSAAILLIGALAVMRGVQIKGRIKRFRRYVDLISTQQMTSIGGLASNIRKPSDFVQKDLQTMIDKRFFTQTSINVATGEIIIHGMNNASLTPEPERLRVVVCKGCGATSQVVAGKVAECAYCGSLLQ